MIIEKYLVINKTGYKNKVTLINKVDSRKTIPSNSVVLKLDIELPNALFERPQLSATIKVPADKVSKSVINADVLDNIQSAMQKMLGVDLNITIVEKEN